MKVSETKMLGAYGEAEAVKYLLAHHYKVDALHYYSRFGEIDIIAHNWRYILFVEVKTRRTARYGEAREYVNRPKQDRIRMTASIYLEKNPTRRQPRFDVIEVYAPESYHTEHPVIYHWEDAFQ